VHPSTKAMTASSRRENDFMHGCLVEGTKREKPYDIESRPTQRNLSVDILGALAAIKYFAPYMEERRKGTILLTGGGLALGPSAEYLSLSIGKAGIRCLAQALFPQLSAKGIHIATLTVTMMVSPGSEQAAAAAEAFWSLHAEPEGRWTWEATLK